MPFRNALTTFNQTFGFIKNNTSPYGRHTYVCC